MDCWPSEKNIDSQGLYPRSTSVRATSWCSLVVRKYRVMRDNGTHIKETGMKSGERIMQTEM
jgi:hypothetical protein